jgi:hypothetical protein
LIELSRVNHLLDDIQPPNEVAFYNKLWVRRPVIKFL